MRNISAEPLLAGTDRDLMQLWGLQKTEVQYSSEVEFEFLKDW